jgi:hypothetical protein
VHVGDPRFDAAMTAEFEQARRVFGASGAKLVLMTAPCYAAREGADGSLPPEDDPARVARFNSLITSFAAAHAADVRVVDLFGAVCPGGRFTPTLSGVPVRTPDGVHFDMGNLGPALAPVLLPELRAAAH